MWPRHPIRSGGGVGTVLGLVVAAAIGLALAAACVGDRDPLAAPEPATPTSPASVEAADPTRLRQNGHEIELFDSTEHLTDLVAWALTTYADAGLALPDVASVHFDHGAVSCEGLEGWAVLAEGGYQVHLCFDPAVVCADPGCRIHSGVARHTIVHEFAHIWLHANLGLDDEAAFVDLLGLTSWNDPEDRWCDRGVEWAAESLTWHLLDHGVEPTALGRPSDDVLADLVTFLLERSRATSP